MILVAPDSFGGWKTAPEVAQIICDRLRHHRLQARSLPLSDGGEGLLTALSAAGFLDRTTQISARGPHGEPRTGPIGWHQGRPIVESATWLGGHRDQPLLASSAGLAAVLSSLMDGPHGIIGLGGSVTTDLGLPLLERLPPGSLTGWTVWADVSTPAVACVERFGPQKGLTPVQITALTAHFEQQVAALASPQVPRDLPGGGAAGGVGFALALLGAQVVSGAAAVAALLLQDALHQDIDRQIVVVTGEGRLDRTTAEDKLVAQVARLCAASSVGFAAVVGQRCLGAPELPGPVFVADAHPGPRQEQLICATDALARWLTSSRSRRGADPRRPAP